MGPGSFVSWRRKLEHGHPAFRGRYPKHKPFAVFLVGEILSCSIEQSEVLAAHRWGARSEHVVDHRLTGLTNSGAHEVVDHGGVGADV